LNFICWLEVVPFLETEDALHKIASCAESAVNTLLDVSKEKRAKLLILDQEPMEIWFIVRRSWGHQATNLADCVVQICHFTSLSVTSQILPNHCWP